MTVEAAEWLSLVWKFSVSVDTASYSYLLLQGGMVVCVDGEGTVRFRVSTGVGYGILDGACCKSMQHVIITSVICHAALRLLTPAQPGDDGLVMPIEITPSGCIATSCDSCGCPFTPTLHPLASPFHCIDYLLRSVVESRCLVFECRESRLITSSGMTGVTSIGMHPDVSESQDHRSSIDARPERGHHIPREVLMN